MSPFEYVAASIVGCVVIGYILGHCPRPRPPTPADLSSPEPVPIPAPGETWRLRYREGQNPFDPPELVILRTLRGWVEFERKNAFPGLPSNRDQWPIAKFTGVYERIEAGRGTP